MSGHDNSFVVVANRLPVDLEIQPDGTRTWKASPGGLVTALSPVLEAEQGCWVGWPGITNDAPEPFHTENGVLLHPVKLTDVDYEGFYEGFSNATLWPLYHDLIVTPQYKREWWYSYREVNLRFAEEVAKVAAPNATVWYRTISCSCCQAFCANYAPISPSASSCIFHSLPQISSCNCHGAKRSSAG